MDFVKIGSFNTRMEAETIGHALDQYDIPHLVKLDDAGGMLVQMLPGASLWVPEDKASEARQLLACVLPSQDTDEGTDTAEPPPDD